MSRKNTEKGNQNRSKKTVASSSTPGTQVAAEIRRNLVPINLEDEIRRRAYEIYVERGCTAGDEHEDWLAAEREIRARYPHQERQAQTA
ncbi:MAG: DUF2934 domain-containing protein [Terriglobales bacterium]